MGSFGRNKKKKTILEQRLLLFPCSSDVCATRRLAFQPRVGDSRLTPVLPPACGVTSAVIGSLLTTPLVCPSTPDDSFIPYVCTYVVSPLLTWVNHFLSFVYQSNSFIDLIFLIRNHQIHNPITPKRPFVTCTSTTLWNHYLTLQDSRVSKANIQLELHSRRGLILKVHV